MENATWGAALRFCQALIQATPTILVGLIVAGVLRRMLGHDGTRRLFGESGWRGLLRAWLIGMLLPVCSLGVLPVLRELRRAGLSGGTILAFGLTAPLFNPISVLYGLTLADPLVILTFSLCSLVIVTVAGVAWDKIFPETRAVAAEPPRVTSGLWRMASIGVFGAREVIGPALGYVTAGLVGVAALSFILPHGYLQSAAEPEDPWAPLFMAAVAIPVYATPMTAMVQLASMFQHGNSVGAGFSLLALGAGANLGLAAWIVRHYGLRRAAGWFALLFAIVVGLAYGVDKPLYPKGAESAGHTHAFDGYCSPFHWNTQDPKREVWRTLREKTSPEELISLAGLALLGVAGLILRVCDPKQRLEAWLERPPSGERRLDMVLPAPVLGVVALLAMIALSVLGCYVYYPPADEIFEEMRIADAEVFTATTSQDWDKALLWIPIYDDWTRKLQVTTFLRGERLNPYRRAKAEVLREKLELLEHEIEDQEIEEAQRLGLAVSRAYSRLRTAFRDR